MKIRRALHTDAAPLAALAERTFRMTFAADNTAADMDRHCAVSYSFDIQALELADAATHTLVVEDDDGALVAFAQLRRGPTPPVVPDRTALEIWRFYVDHAHHGRGLAQSLMAATIECARERGAPTLWLGVWERNLRAQAFYRKMGFVDVGAHEFRLGDDIQIDRVMVRGAGELNGPLRSRKCSRSPTRQFSRRPAG